MQRSLFLPLLFVALFLLICLPIKAQTIAYAPHAGNQPNTNLLVSDIRSELDQFVAEVVRDYNVNKIDQFMTHFPSDHVQTDTRGSQVGVERKRKIFTGMFERFNATMTAQTTDVLPLPDDYAWIEMTYTLDLQPKAGGNAVAVNHHQCVLVQKVEGKWLIKRQYIKTPEK